MTLLADEELRAFLDEHDFAVEAIYDGGTAVVGIRAEGYAETAFGGVGIQGTAPRFTCIAADVDADPTGKTLAIGEASYTIMRGEPDGTGFTRLVLQAA